MAPSPPVVVAEPGAVSNQKEEIPGETGSPSQLPYPQNTVEVRVKAVSL